MTRRALLIHGLSSSSQTWWRVAPALEADGWEVVTPDLRGHGSASRADRYTFSDYASDLPAGPWDLVIGHSLGGAVAVVVAGAGATSRLILLDPVLEVAAAEFEAVKADQLAELDLTIEKIRAEKPHWDSHDHELKIAAVGQADRAAIERTFTDNPGWSVVNDAMALTMPTLILGADHRVYSMLSAETANAVVAANPLVSYRVLEGSGHSPHRDLPDETIAAIRAFVA